MVLNGVHGSMGLYIGKLTPFKLGRWFLIVNRARFINLLMDCSHGNEWLEVKVLLEKVFYCEILIAL